MMTLKQYKTITAGHSTELDAANLFVPMTFNDEYIKQFGDGARGQILVLEQIFETKNHAANASLYSTIVSGTSSVIHPDDKLILTLQLRNFTLDAATTTGGIQFWFQMNEYWVSMSFRFDDTTTDGNGPVIITRTFDAFDIGIVAEGEFTYNLIIQTGTSGNPTTTLYADGVSPIILSMERA